MEMGHPIATLLNTSNDCFDLLNALIRTFICFRHNCMCLFVFFFFTRLTHFGVTRGRIERWNWNTA